MVASVDPDNPLLHDVYHYEDASECPEDIVKYWHQRYEIFSKYDDGVWLTHDAWFGVTPEPVANKIAAQVAAAAPASKKILVDAFAGAGGNTIAFALSNRWERIFAIESDPQVLECAKHNAEVYGVSSKIFWIKGDSFEEVKKRMKPLGGDAVIFASPPWGGPGYRDDEVFDLKTMQPYGLGELYRCYERISKEIVLFLPRTSDLNQLAKYAGEEGGLQVAHYCMHGASKALCAYYGNFGPIA
ncbi:putative RNA methylase family protein [Saccharata proteae CBS 121410]|uniref:Trimethylguanosine synthase n=1 Tax=Saccharata proteae CBS 121410 TaxID=1314787 RepID=A0A9P4LWQ3_9PEZI|nr:putative RNA methylase family protein [Saccharata proteae CBS 121410]